MSKNKHLKEIQKQNEAVFTSMKIHNTNTEADEFSSEVKLYTQFLFKPEDESKRFKFAVDISNDSHLVPYGVTWWKNRSLKSLKPFLRTSVPDLANIPVKNVDAYEGTDSFNTRVVTFILTYEHPVLMNIHYDPQVPVDDLSNPFFEPTDLYGRLYNQISVAIRKHLEGPYFIYGSYGHYDDTDYGMMHYHNGYPIRKAE